MKQWAYWLPLLLVVALCAVLWKGLSLNPHELPSTRLNQPAPAFALRDLQSGQIIQAGLFKNHWTLLNVWASWCETCVEEQAFLLQLKKRYPTLQFVGLAFQDKPDQALDWLARYGNPYDRVLLDQSGTVGVDYGVYGTPETFLIDPAGIIRIKITGALNPQTWQPAAAYLKE